jgi:hypothetical protein
MQDEYVINPYSGHYIKVNGKLYNRLLHEGILSDKTNRPNNVVYEGKDKTDVINIRKNLKCNEPGKTLKIRDNKIMKINKRLTSRDYRDKVVTASARIMRDKINNNDEELKKLSQTKQEDYIKSLLYKELVLNSNPVEIKEVSKRKINNNMLQKKHVLSDTSKQNNIKKSKYKIKTPMTTDNDEYDINSNVGIDSDLNSESNYEY